MKKKALGNSSLFISPIGLGCMGFSHAYGMATERCEAERMIKTAYDMGYTFFDTAECYTGMTPDGTVSYNEELVGNALRSVRDQVVIATKFGVCHNPDKSLTLNSTPEAIRKAVEGSLQRLGIDCIDLYYQHRIDPKVPAETVAAAMAELIKDGKIKHWGISEANEDYLRKAHAVCPVSAIQNRYSMMARHHEKLFPVLEELGITFVAFSPMANGLLSGKFSAETLFTDNSDYRSFMPQFTKEGMEKAQDLLDLLKTLAKEKNAAPGQISLAWMMCKKPYIVPIPGSRKSERLRENLGSADIILTQDEIKTIDNKLDTMDFLVFGGSVLKN